jgi:hypothetical protein
MKTKKAILKCLYVLTAVSLFTFKCIGQTNIGGIINTYTKVISLPSSCTCPSVNCASATVASAAGFAANDFVLIMQMKGARADSSNTIAHGDIINLYDAGNYEFDTICSISGNTITFKVPLKQTYFTNTTIADSAYVQLIKVPVYTGNVNVTSTLTPQAWTASTGTGGVLAFVVTGTLTLQANISADGKGFTGPTHVLVPISCTLDTAFYYQSTAWNYASCTSCGYVYDDAVTRRVGQAAYGGCGTTCFTNRLYVGDNKASAFRGEGIVANTFKKTFANGNVALFNKGKGKWGNGGGSGGNHNAGGGGGGNYGAGGYGGNAINNTSQCDVGTLTNRKGHGGVALTPTGSKIFMGGGGGEGHDNGGNGSTGTNGGGIIIIQAANVTNGGAFTISANGVDNTVIASGDGSGGGGAGGTILMDVSASYTNAITISAKGGKGGSHNNNNCHGTGGGGGGGVIWFSTGSGSIPPNVTADVTSGANGVQVAATIDCGDVNWGATAGGAGGVLTGLASGSTVFLNMNSCNSALPVELVSFRADVVDNNVELNWTTGSEYNSDYFTIERSEDGVQFSRLLQKAAAGNSSSTRYYSAADEHPLYGISYYRLSQTNFDGVVHYSQVISITIAKTPELTVFPNPVEDYFVISFEGTKNFSFTLMDMAGNNLMEQKNLTASAKINTQSFQKGIYYVKGYSGKTMFVKKIVIM